MKSEPLVLPRNCGNCRFFDGDCWCSLPVMKRHMRGAIVEPEALVCAKHEPKNADDVEGAAV